jgi:tetrapyrrole methylase family protein/MazG family protein
MSRADEDAALVHLVAVVARLRRECPWDRDQTHRSLRPYLLEEAYEVLEALDAGDPSRLRDELGDLLLQVLMHAAIAAEAGSFDINSVAAATADKMVRRHPHVFGTAAVGSAEEVLHNWEALKANEYSEERSSVLDGVPPALPALVRAGALQRRAARVGFEWPDLEHFLESVGAEARELAAAAGPPAQEAEFGDLLLGLVALGRQLHLNAEDALRAATARFEARFRVMERLAQERGVALETAGSERLQALWQAAKKAAGSE